MKRNDLSRIETETYDFIRQVGEVQPRNLPDNRMVGAVTGLVNKGLVTIYKRYTSRHRRRKKKFVKIQANNPPETSEDNCKKENTLES